MTKTQSILSDTTLTCTVCGESTATFWRSGFDHLLGGTHRYRAVTCTRCGTRRLDPRPDVETMAAYYQPDTYARAEDPESEVGKRLDAYAFRLANRVPERNGNTALDVGCGDGRFMAALQKRQWHVTGTETDPVAAELARNRTGSEVFDTPFPPVNPEPHSGFDLITLLHVLEHVPDPRATLHEIRIRLSSGGKMLLVLPNADSMEAHLFGNAWYHLDLPRHLWAFTPQSLVRLVETCGFTIDEIRYTPFLFTPQSLLRVFGKVNGAIPGRHVQGTGRSGSGGSWQTTLFRNLLDVSNTVGVTIPGEIIELTASRTGNDR